MSKRFDVSLESLLQLEEHSCAALPSSPPPLYPPWLPLAALCVGVLGLLLALGSLAGVQVIRQQLVQLQAEVNHARYMTQQPPAVQEEPSPLDGWTQRLVRVDPLAETVTYTFTANPKAVTANTTVTFLAKLGDQTYEFPATLQEPNLVFIAEESTLPMGEAELSAVVDDGGTRRRQLLLLPDQTDLIRLTPTAVQEDTLIFSRTYPLDCKFTVHIQGGGTLDQPDSGVWPVEVGLMVYLNGALLGEYPADSAALDQPIPCRLELPPLYDRQNDHLEILAYAVDNLGRRTQEPPGIAPAPADRQISQVPR